MELQDWSTHLGRERGILTDHDRRYLLGELEDELSDNAEYQKRHQIRNRIRNSILDFYLLSEKLGFDDIIQVFEPAYSWARKSRLINENKINDDYPHIPEFVNAWVEGIEFFYYSLILIDIDESTRLANWAIETGIEQAIRRYGFEIESEFWDADITIEGGLSDRMLIEKYVQTVVDALPRDKTEAESYLIDLYKINYLPAHLAIYIYEAYVREDS